jgi:hypothetical protein
MSRNPHIRTIDSKGRVNVGVEHAGLQVILEESPTELLLKPVKAVPVREAWLWENQAALESVRQGIEQAASGDLSSGPENLDDMLDFAETLED